MLTISEKGWSVLSQTKDFEFLEMRTSLSQYLWWVCCGKQILRRLTQDWQHYWSGCYIHSATDSSSVEEAKKIKILALQVQTHEYAGGGHVKYICQLINREGKQYMCSSTQLRPVRHKIQFKHLSRMIGIRRLTISKKQRAGSSGRGWRGKGRWMFKGGRVKQRLWEKERICS